MRTSLTALLAFALFLCAQPRTVADTPKDGNPAITANNDLAMDLYAQLAAKNPGKNLIYSPYSISNALAIVTEGARNETADEMGKALRYPKSLRRAGAADQPWDLEQIHAGIVALNKRLEAANRPVPKDVQEKLDALRKDLASTSKAAASSNDYKLYTRAKKLAEELNKLQSQWNPYEVRVANSMWGEKTYPFKKSFFTTIDKHYGASVFSVDYINAYEPARKKINAWVEERTRDRIKDLIPAKAIDDATRMVIANAVYFKGDWAQPFKEAQTKDLPFILGDGKKLDVKMMQGLKSNARYAAFNKDGSFFNTPMTVEFGKKLKPSDTYPDEDGFELAEMPYRGGELSMVVLVPRSAKGLANAEKMLAGHLQTWIAKMRQRSVDVHMPRFKIETPFDVKTAFESLGMKRAFTDPRAKNGAQFEGMSEATDPMNKLYITKILHKAFVEVNEKGTEAAAATAVIMAVPTSAPISMPFIPVLKADKPFVYLIRDHKTGAILFMGRVTNPKE